MISRNQSTASAVPETSHSASLSNGAASTSASGLDAPAMQDFSPGPPHESRLGPFAAATSTEPNPTALDIDQATTLLGEIALLADVVKRLLCECLQHIDDPDAVAHCVASESLVGQIGWMSDLAAKKLGGGEIRGGAEVWTLPPIYEEGSYRLRQAAALGVEQ